VAKVLIASGDHNVTEACYAVGFNDASYCTRVFREVDGSSPKSYMGHGGRSLDVEA
jgi:AraC-like DNA-binding protein